MLFIIFFGPLICILAGVVTIVPIWLFKQCLIIKLTVHAGKAHSFQGWDERRASSLRLLDIMQKTNICGIMIP